MEQIKKIINFLSISYPRHTDEERHSFNKSNYIIPNEITRWWNIGLQDFIKYVHKSDAGEGMFAYVKSCQYTDNLIKELKLSISSLVQESYLKSENMLLENQELKSLIYGMLAENNELKEYNKSLNERILLLEKSIELKNKIKELSEHNKQLSYRLSVFED